MEHYEETDLKCLVVGQDALNTKIDTALEEVEEVRAAVLGNGDPENCLAVRIKTCEAKLVSLKTAIYFLLATMLTAGITAAAAAVYARL